MPSLHKRSGSPFWVVAFTDANGRRLKKSTKTTERALAMKIAIDWENAAKAGRAGRLIESQCRKVLSELHEQATGEPLHFHSCRDWVNEWLAGKVGATSEGTLIKYKQVCGDFLGFLGERADLPINAISQRDIRAFRDKLAKAGRSPSTVNQTVRKVLSAPFQAAVRLGYVSVNPCSAVESLQDNEVGEKDIFTPEQVLKLYSVAKGDWRGVILTGYLTGLRLRDITELRWESVDIESELLRVKTRKTGSTVLLPIPADLIDWLRSQPRGIGKAAVFPSLAGKSGAGKSGLSMQFKNIMEAAGISGRVLREKAQRGKGRTQTSLSFHSLRHSFNSALANSGVSQEIRQKLTGHASAAMNAKYTHHEIDTLRDAVKRLPKVIPN